MIKVWFLKASDQAWEVAIEAATGPHCHMEIQFSDQLFYSSTNDLGPRFTTLNNLFDTDINKWDIIDIPTTVDDEKIVRSLAEMITKGLDKDKPVYGINHIILDFLPIPLSFNTPNDWICSQLCVYICQSIGLFMGFIPQQISPHEAYEILNKELPIWQTLRFQEVS